MVQPQTPLFVNVCAMKQNVTGSSRVFKHASLSCFWPLERALLNPSRRHTLTTSSSSSSREWEDAFPSYKYLLQRRHAAVAASPSISIDRSIRSIMPRNGGRCGGGPKRRRLPQGRRARKRRARNKKNALERAATDARATDLVERLDGPERRLDENRLLRVEDNAQIQEWRLRVGIQQLLQILHPDNASSLDVAERLLSFLLNVYHAVLRVVWLTDTHYVVCQNKYSGEEDEDDAHHVFVWSLTLHCEELRSYHLWLYAVARGTPPEPDVLRVLHRLGGLGTIVRYAYVDFNEDLFPEMLPGIDDFVSMARSRRLVKVLARVSSETGRALAYNCNPLVELLPYLPDWDDHGAALAEAMVANRCPAVLALENINFRVKHSLAAAIAVTSSLKDLTLTVQSLTSDAAIFDAIARNQSIRSLTVYTTERLDKARPVHETESFWLSMFQSSSIQTIRTRTTRCCRETLDDDNGERSQSWSQSTSETTIGSPASSAAPEPTTHKSWNLVSHLSFA